MQVMISLIQCWFIFSWVDINLLPVIINFLWKRCGMLWLELHKQNNNRLPTLEVLHNVQQRSYTEIIDLLIHHRHQNWSNLSLHPGWQGELSLLFCEVVHVFWGQLSCSEYSYIYRRLLGITVHLVTVHLVTASTASD